MTNIKSLCDAQAGILGGYKFSKGIFIQQEVFYKTIRVCWVFFFFWQWMMYHLLTCAYLLEFNSRFTSNLFFP